jgi:hypothetical protein
MGTVTANGGPNMIDYSTWKESYLAVTTLLLDPHNPRIPDSGVSLSQRELLADLVANDKVHELAKSIVKNGYYPTEALIYVEENGKKYVVEGNRRLAALKLLLSPEAADASWERRFRALANRIDTRIVRKVKAVRAPSRRAAAPIIMSRHTLRQVEGWNPLMQSKFYSNLVEGGLTVEDIAREYNVRASEIAGLLQRHTMYAIACALDLPEDVARTVQNPRAFPVTSLDRLYKNPRVNDFLGISFDENKELVGKVAAGEFKKGYAKIIADIATSKVDSRILNTTTAMDEYLASIADFAPDLTKRDGFTASTLLKAATKRPTSAKRSSLREVRKPKPKPKALIPSTVSCDVNNQRVNAVFGELQTLPVARYPNAVALMFRGLLEMSLGHYLEQTGHMSKLTQNLRQARENRNNKLPADYHPTVKEMLKYVVAKDTNIITNGNLLQALNKFISQKDKLFSIDTLHLFAHNEYFPPSEADLRGFWEQLRPLFEIVLVEPTVDDEAE